MLSFLINACYRFKKKKKASIEILLFNANPVRKFWLQTPETFTMVVIRSWIYELQRGKMTHFSELLVYDRSSDIAVSWGRKQFF